MSFRDMRLNACRHPGFGLELDKESVTPAATPMEPYNNRRYKLPRAQPELQTKHPNT